MRVIHAFDCDGPTLRLTPSPSTGEGWGEGDRLFDSLGYLRQHPLQVSQYLIVPESQYPIPVALEPHCPLRIRDTNIRLIVMAAVNLYDPCFKQKSV